MAGWSVSELVSSFVLALAQRGRGHEAAALLRMALELEPDDGDAAAMLTMLERQFGGAGRGRVRT